MHKERYIISYDVDLSGCVRNIVFGERLVPDEDDAKDNTEADAAESDEADADEDSDEDDSEADA